MAHQHFANAVNAGIHPPGSAIARRILNHPVGRITVAVATAGWAAGTTVVTARRELVPATPDFTGFPDLAAARAFAAGQGPTLIALLRLSDDKIHAFDTERIVPHPEGVPGSAGTSHVEVSSFAQHGLFDVVDWVHLDLAPRDRLPDPAFEGVPHAAGPDPFDLFAAHNSGLGTARLDQIRQAIEETTGRDIEVRNAFYANFTENRLSVANGPDLDKMNRLDFDAWTGETHNTLVRDLVFGYSPIRLGSVLLHEMMHGRPDHPVTDATGGPEPEGEAYALQYFFVEQAHGPDEELDRILTIAATGGGEVAYELRSVELHRFRVTYTTLVTLQQIIDGTFAFSDAPFAHRISSSRAGELMRELASHYARTGEVAEISSWCEENLSRFHLPVHRGAPRPPR